MPDDVANLPFVSITYVNGRQQLRFSQAALGLETNLCSDLPVTEKTLRFSALSR